MNKYMLLSLPVLLLAFTFVQPAMADNCSTQYGQYGTNCVPELKIVKKVRNPITGEFKDDLSQTDATYSVDSEVTYSLFITNNSQKDLDSVTVTDTLPDKLNQGSVVDDNKSKVKEEKFENNVLTFKLTDVLKIGQSVEVRIKAKIKSASAFPTGQNVVCVVNKAEVKAEDKSGEDTASLCVQTNVLGVTTLPQAGPEDYLPLLPYIGTAITGMVLIFKRK